MQSTVTIPKTLIIVACHAIFIGSSDSNNDGIDNPHDPTQWLLAPFQTGESPTFIAHIQAGLDLLRRYNDDAILCFSGGATKQGVTGCTEAESYGRVARWLIRNEREKKGVGEDGKDDEKGVLKRIFEERWATDSFQNILFGILGFGVWRRNYVVSSSSSSSEDSKGELLLSGVSEYGSSQGWPVLPKRLVIISHDFKRARFLKLHLPAIRELLPIQRREEFDEMEVEYVGINPPFTDEELKEVEDGERKRGFQPWVDDRFGNGEFLDGKRRGRGWDEKEYLGWWRGQIGDGKEEFLREVKRIISGSSSAH